MPWATNPGLTNEVVYTLSIDCSGGGLVCDALDAYSDVQVALVDGAGDVDIDVSGGTLQFLQDGTQDVGSGPQPSYATVNAADLTFAEIPFVGEPMTEQGVVFALTNPIIASAGGALTMGGSYPISVAVDYSAIADVVGPVDAWVPDIVVTPQSVTLTGTLKVVAIAPDDTIFYRIENLTGSLMVSNPTTLLGESVTVNVIADMTLNLQGNNLTQTVPGGQVPGLGGWGLTLLAGALALAGARVSRARSRS